MREFLFSYGSVSLSRYAMYVALQDLVVKMLSLGPFGIPG
jgi:hypothetical protein